MKYVANNGIKNLIDTSSHREKIQLFFPFSEGLVDQSPQEELA